MKKRGGEGSKARSEQRGFYRPKDGYILSLTHSILALMRHGRGGGV